MKSRRVKPAAFFIDSCKNVFQYDKKRPEISGLLMITIRLHSMQLLRWQRLENRKGRALIELKPLLHL